MKYCPKCEETRSVKQFSKNRRTKDGLEVWCKVCRKAYRDANKEAQRARWQAWYQNELNRKTVIDRASTWNLENQTERRKISVRAAHRRRARERAGGYYTQQEWEALCEKYGNKCLRCGASGPLSVDHVIPISKGGSNTIDNLQPLCWPCNNRKNARHIDYRPDHAQKAA